MVHPRCKLYGKPPPPTSYGLPWIDINWLSHSIDHILPALSPRWKVASFLDDPWPRQDGSISFVVEILMPTPIRFDVETIYTLPTFPLDTHTHLNAKYDLSMVMIWPRCSDSTLLHFCFLIYIKSHECTINIRYLKIFVCSWKHVQCCKRPQ